MAKESGIEIQKHMSVVVHTQVVAGSVQQHLAEMRIANVQQASPTGEHHFSANVELNGIRIFHEFLH